MDFHLLAFPRRAGEWVQGQRAFQRPECRSEHLALRSRSIPESLQGQTRPAADALIAVVSRWPEFLRWARAILIAAGLDPDSLSFRNAQERGWQRGLKSAALVVTDSLMARELPGGCEVRLFTILSDSSLDEMRGVAEHFISLAPHLSSVTGRS